jgi:pimeloyl-ACP methyl ester carboxylesterase
VSGGHIWAEEAGPAGAPLVVVIHGSMDRATGMLKVSRQLDDRFRVLRYDRRGYGRSHPHPGPFTLDANVADLVTLLAGRRAVLVGHSYGGDVALAAADRHPDLVAGVAVYETPLSWEPWWPGNTAGSVAVAAAPRDPGQAAEVFMRRMIGSDRWDALPERTRETRRAEGQAMVGELSDLRRGPAWNPARITCPVVVSFGGNGAAHHRRGMTHASEILACPVVELDDCRHDAPLSDAALFTTRVIEPVLSSAGPPWSEAASASG